MVSGFLATAAAFNDYGSYILHMFSHHSLVNYVNFSPRINKFKLPQTDQCNVPCYTIMKYTKVDA